MMRKTILLLATLILLTLASASKCGKKYGQCPKGQCCSKYGYCGKGKMYCGVGCNSEFGACDSVKATITKTKVVKATPSPELIEKIIEKVDAIIGDVDAEKVVEEVNDAIENAVIENAVDSVVESELESELDNEKEETEDAVAIDDNDENNDVELEADEIPNDDEIITITEVITEKVTESPEKENGDESEKSDDETTTKSETPVPTTATSETPVQSTTSEEPVPSTTSEKPVQSTSTEEPVPTTTSEKPVQSSSTEEPVPTTTSETPVQSTTSEEPVPSTTSEKPVQSTSTKEPVPTTTSEKPVQSSTVEAQAQSTTTEEPVPTTTSEKPVQSTTTEEPAPTTTSEKPVQSTTTEAPVQSTTTEDAVTTVVITESTVTITTEVPVATTTTSEAPVVTTTTTTSEAPVTTTTTTEAPAPTGECSTEVFGIVSKFNAFFFGDFTGYSSDVQGRLAAKGTVNISGGYQSNAFVYDAVSHQQQSNFGCEESKLKDDFKYAIVAGTINFKDGGEISNGGIAYTNSASLPGYITDSIKNKKCPNEKKEVINFDTEKENMIKISNKLTNFGENCKKTHQWGKLTVDLVQGQKTCYVTIDDLSQINNIVINENGTKDVTIVFNIKGEHVTFTNFDIFNLNKYATRILWNAPNATKLTIQNFRIQGTLLAPNADIEGNNSNIQGQIIGKSLKGNMQMDWVPFYGCI